MKPRISLGLLVALLVLCVSPVALAGPTYQTKLSINYSRSSGGYFAGKLRSHGGCVAGRDVVVYLKSSGTDPTVGRDTTAASGKWRVAPGQIAAGDYYAKTQAVKIGAGTCAGAKSATTRAS